MITTDPKTRKSKTALWFLEEKTRVFSAMDSVYASVANLTQWADRLIVEGKVDPTEDYQGGVVDPVRKSVEALAALVTDLDRAPNVPAELPKSTSMHNSLPDITAMGVAAGGGGDKVADDKGTGEDPGGGRGRKTPASAAPAFGTDDSGSASFPPKFRYS